MMCILPFYFPVYYSFILEGFQSCIAEIQRGSAEQHFKLHWGINTLDCAFFEFMVLPLQG